MAPLAAAIPSAGDQIRQWSSLIGIVTAIIGNILISFALNLQRYAHIRIDQEYEDGKQHYKLAKKKSGGAGTYGTQELVAEERTRLNLTAPAAGEGQSRKKHTGSRADETEPLNGSFTSDGTVKPSQSEKLPAEVERRSYLRSPYWWAGIILMTTGEAGNFLAYGFAPASIVSPLGVVALVSNCVIAPFLLKERFRLRDGLGVLVAVAGAVVVVMSAKTQEEKLGPDELWDAIIRWEFELYLGLTIVAIAALMWASPRYGERTILIDLGLVGLFGKLGYTIYWSHMLTMQRGLHGSVDQRSCITTLRYVMARNNVPYNVLDGCRSCDHCYNANPLFEQSTATL